MTNYRKEQKDSKVVAMCTGFIGALRRELRKSSVMLSP
jgi:hypothetical protein